MIFATDQQLADKLLEETTYAALDIETTGISPWSDRIIEIGVVRWSRNARAAEFQDMVNPGIPVKPGAVRVHGLTNADLARAPSFRDIADDLLEELDRTVIITHRGMNFDIPFVNAELARAGRPPLSNVVVDTALISRTPWLQSLGRSLSDMARITGVREGERHRALPDARLVLRVWIALLHGFATFGKRSLLDIHPYLRFRKHHQNIVESFRRARQNSGMVKILYPSGRSVKDRIIIPLFVRRAKLVAVEHDDLQQMTGAFKEFDPQKIIFQD